MKIDTIKSNFDPVCITLETQEEVDIIFAVCDFGPLHREIPLLRGIHVILEVYKSDGYMKTHKILAKIS